jgi:sugar/nucleoside kinase (ribokinase family)
LSADAPLWRAPVRPRDLAGIGQVSLDRVHVVEHAGEAPREILRLPGGQVATACLAAARLGLRVAYAGAVGDDAEADDALAPLRAAGVDCAAVKRVAGGRTRQATVRVERASGERTVEPHRDPRVALRPGELPREWIESARALHLDCEDPDVSLWAAGVANAAGVAVFLDSDRPGPESRALLARVDFAIVSQHFAEAFAGSPQAALPELAALARRVAVVTLGEKGALARERGAELSLAAPAFRVDVRDTTGAGDAYRAGFVWAVLRGRSLRAVLRAANAVGALNCRGLGAQGALPDAAAVEAFLAAHPEA